MNDVCPRCGEGGKEIQYGFQPIWIGIAFVAGTAIGTAVLLDSGLPMMALAGAFFVAAFPALFAIRQLTRFFARAAAEYTRLRCPRCETEWDLDDDS